MNKQEALDEIAKEIEQCAACKQGKIGVAVPGEGDPDADIVFIGEAPGKTEAKTGRPFVGRSGQLLRSVIRDVLGLDDEKDVYITSPVKYLPERGTPTPADIAHAKTHLDKQLAIIEPEIIVLMGSVAAQGVLGEKIPVKTEHGKVIERNGKKYFITVHPAAGLRFPPLRETFQEDFQKLREVLHSVGSPQSSPTRRGR
ncbi:MAG TPA: uracil-DNA glycosylase, partial [Roseiflexaceae bacterium]